MKQAKRGYTKLLIEVRLPKSLLGLKRQLHGLRMGREGGGACAAWGNKTNSQFTTSPPPWWQFTRCSPIDSTAPKYFHSHTGRRANSNSCWFEQETILCRHRYLPSCPPVCYAFSDAKGSMASAMLKVLRVGWGLLHGNTWHLGGNKFLSPVFNTPWRLVAVKTSPVAGLLMCNPHMCLHRRCLMNSSYTDKCSFVFLQY